MDDRNKTIGATTSGLGCAECSAAAEKALLTCSKTAKNARKNAQSIRQRSFSIYVSYSTNIDGGVTNSQPVGAGG